MTARPQDVALLPLPELPVPHGGMTGDYWTDDQIEEYATDYARANVTAALASAQAREDELRAEVEFHKLDAGALRSQMDVLRDGLDVQRRNAQTALNWYEEERVIAERLDEALRDGLSGLNGLFASGDYPLTDEVAELGLAIIEDMQAALSTNAATQTGETT